MSSAITQRDSYLIWFVKVMLRIRCSLSEVIGLHMKLTCFPVSYQKLSLCDTVYNFLELDAYYVLKLLCNQQIVSQWTQALGVWHFTKC